MQVISLISGKGGVGKTTITANLATALAQRDKRVLIIDLDPQNAQRIHLGLDPEEIAGLSREGISPNAIFDSPFGVNFIPFGRLADNELEVFERELREDPYWVARGVASLEDSDFDYVLLDTPPGPTVYLHQALLASQRAFMIVLADAASFATVGKMMGLIGEVTAHEQNFHGVNLLINQMPAQSRLGHQVRTALYDAYAGKLIPVAVHKDAKVSQALAFERPVLEYEPGCMASLDIQYVADWVIDSTSR
ncbi:cellulose biosynthesis protein BcsQ [Noviherbaspirillum galbum]|uniref:Cellulose synthase operon protein YhjQ n=1 Tax=Noviherbaspirillum galbum TaxID=2709383 RepID=A0A6B3SMS9_9BURK|nr:cellulose biosynthesis protein BcsQ [Noviherbaspirillum galbum]NEX60026.1 cellulose synthase operon protein YhjQ [Noviherbaspirillum galbum]